MGLRHSEYMLDQVRSALRHAPRSARGAKPAPLTTERHELVVPAVGAAQAQEAVRQDGLAGVGLHVMDTGSLGWFSFSRRALQRIRHWGDHLRPVPQRWPSSSAVAGPGAPPPVRR